MYTVDLKWIWVDLNPIRIHPNFFKKIKELRTTNSISPFSLSHSLSLLSNATEMMLSISY